MPSRVHAHLVSRAWSVPGTQLALSDDLIKLKVTFRDGELLNLT